MSEVPVNNQGSQERVELGPLDFTTMDAYWIYVSKTTGAGPENTALAAEDRITRLQRVAGEAAIQTNSGQLSLLPEDDKLIGKMYSDVMREASIANSLGYTL